MTKKRGYSNWIKPVLYIVDLLLIFVFLNFFLTKNTIDLTFFAAFWIALSISFSFYNVYRFTKIIEIVSLLFKQISIFVLFIFTYLYIKDLKIPFENVLRFFVFTLVLFNLWRIILHIIFRKYRIITGSNYKQVVIVGWNHSAKKLEEFFYNHPGYGYKFIGYFTNEEEKEKKGSIAESFDFILKNRIDEVYCSVKELTNSQIKEFIDFCDINLKTLKFIPDSKELFSKNLYLNYYDITPILSLRDIPLNDPIKTLSKRIFDILFSSVIIIFVLSWAIPILGLIIVLESRGPIFFKQNRPGIKEKGFGCYKFRSMTLNGRAEDSATRNDIRVTRVGKFIRRTSIDELPQFYNVLFGNMSVVGPRPHMLKHTDEYANKVDKYMLRHFVKPGITGLAQVRGYRGEIEKDSDIQNRIKFDIFYVENWSFFLDLKIVLQTVINAVKGEEKAY